MNEHIKWSESNVFPKVREGASNAGVGETNLRAKYKISGTNVAIRVFNHVVTAQGPSNDLTSYDDIEGFHQFVNSLQIDAEENIIIDGVWSKGIFCVHAIRVFNEDFSLQNVIVEPTTILEYIEETPQIEVLSWYSRASKLDFQDETMLDRFESSLPTKAKKASETEGVEGLIYFNLDDERQQFWAAWLFETKG